MRHIDQCYYQHHQRKISDNREENKLTVKFEKKAIKDKEDYIFSIVFQEQDKKSTYSMVFKDGNYVILEYHNIPGITEE